MYVFDVTFKTAAAAVAVHNNIGVHVQCTCAVCKYSVHVRGTFTVYVCTVNVPHFYLPFHARLSFSCTYLAV